jgi:hypothetical protein
MGSYKYETYITYEEIAAKMGDDEIGDLTSFLRSLEEKLRKRSQPEEEASAPLPEDLYIMALADGIKTGLANAHSAFKNANRIFFGAPTHEQIQAQITELMRQRAERLAKEQAAEAVTFANFDALLPKVEDEAREFYKLCVDHPIDRLYYDGAVLTIRHKDGVLKDQPMSEDAYQRTRSYWDRWNSTQTLKGRRIGEDVPKPTCVSRDEQGINNGKGHPVGSHAQ